MISLPWTRSNPRTRDDDGKSVPGIPGSRTGPRPRICARRSCHQEERGRDRRGRRVFAGFRSEIRDRQGQQKEDHGDGEPADAEEDRIHVLVGGEIRTIARKKPPAASMSLSHRLSSRPCLPDGESAPTVKENEDDDLRGTTNPAEGRVDERGQAVEKRRPVRGDVEPCSGPGRGQSGIPERATTPHGLRVASRRRNSFALILLSGRDGRSQAAPAASQRAWLP